MTLAFFSLSQDTKDYFKDFGSEAVAKLAFRDAWVMIGQRGLGPGKAIEQVVYNLWFEDACKRLAIGSYSYCFSIADIIRT